MTSRSRTPRIQRRIDAKLPARKKLQLPGDPLGDESLLAPVVDGWAGDAESFCGGAYTSEVVGDIISSHETGMYTTLTLDVNKPNARMSDNSRVQTMGQRIRTLREAQGMTQATLAKAVGVSRGAVAQWELGIVANIRLQSFLKLCEVLRTDPQYLLFGSGRHPRSQARSGGTNTP